jgi:hypothetical protein
MNRKSIFVFLFIILATVFSLNAAEFPTDIGSVGMHSNLLINSGEQESMLFYGSVEYYIAQDVSLGLWLRLEEVAAQTHWRVGPQLKYYFNGHKHKPKLKGDFLLYMGFGIFYFMKNRQVYYLYSNNDTRHSKGLGYRFMFGTDVMFLNHIGAFGEFSIILDGSYEPSGGCVRHAGAALDSGFTFGISVFLY